MRYDSDYFQNNNEVLLTTAKEFLCLLIQCLLNLVCFDLESRPTKTISYGNSSVAIGCERLKKM